MSDRETLELDILIVGGGPAGHVGRPSAGAVAEGKGRRAVSDRRARQGARARGARAVRRGARSVARSGISIPDFEAKGAPLACRRCTTTTCTSSPRAARCGFRSRRRRCATTATTSSRSTSWSSGWPVRWKPPASTSSRASPPPKCCTTATRVVGVRTGDRGLDKQGGRKSTFEPGVDIRAKTTIFCDGVRGNLTKTLVAKLKLDDGRLPQLYALGIKELWEVPPDRLATGTVIHTMGYPLKMEEFGGAFIYAHAERSAVGRIRLGSRLQGSDVRSAPDLPAFQAAPVHRESARWRQDGALRREGAARGRVAHGAARAHGWRAHRRGCRWLHELDAAQGHPPRHAHRNARGRNGIRRRARRRCVGGASGPLPGGDRGE